MDASAIPTLRASSLSRRTLQARHQSITAFAQHKDRGDALDAMLKDAPDWVIDHLPVLHKCELFADLDDREIVAALPCLGATTKRYDKGEYLLRAGDVTHYVHVVLEGKIKIIREDWWGNRNIISTARPGESFAEAYACSRDAALPIAAVAAKPSLVLSLEAFAILRSCRATCTFHARLMENMVDSLAHRNLELNSKLSLLAQRSTREKVLAYLSEESQRQGSSSFTIPYNRQELADYLSVNRSALSTELGKLRDEGVIDFDRSRFTLLTEG